MKITDFAMIFIAITLPIIIVVYINVSYTIKAEEQEMYYEQLINSAIEDATAMMKEVENEDKDIDYGYSGEEDKKISVNANVAASTFFEALYNNFGVKGNVSAQSYLQLFVPALAIIDYNGVYISSVEEYSRDNTTVIEHAIKPKKYYTYTYYIINEKDEDKLYKIVNAEEYSGNKDKILSCHTIEFTMDDYVTHRGYVVGKRGSSELKKWSFYLADTRKGTLVEGNVSTANDIINNKDLYKGSSEEDSENLKMLEKIVNHLKAVKDQVIIKTITDELAYSVNSNNFYASNSGITYDFVFPQIEEAKMGDYIDEVGIFAFVQGISVGNKYLDTQAYSVSRLELVNRYYLSIPKKDAKGNLVGSKFSKNLYHSNVKCPEYINSIHEDVTPIYVTTKQQATSVVGVYKPKSGEQRNVIGFYPCPVCMP